MNDVNELVAEAQNGDLGAYEEIVRRFQASAFGQAFSVLGDSHLAEDAVQDAFVDAYRNLGALRTAGAFPGWFRKVVATACHRIIRRQDSPVSASLEELDDIPIDEAGPSDLIQRSEQERIVHVAIQQLPDTLKMVTSLYYIGGMSQRAVAEYLGLTETTVKKRLHNARLKLKDSIMNMAKTISDDRLPAERVSAKVIAELVSRPQPLLVESHPLKQIVDQIVAALPDYTMIDSSEIENNDMYPSIQQQYAAGSANAYQLDSENILRTHTSGATLRAIKGRTAPVRLLSTGRVYRPIEEDDQHLKVFHQLDGICVSADADLTELKSTLSQLLEKLLGPVVIRYRDEDYGWVDHGLELEAKVDGQWSGIAGCGLLKPEMLSEAGYDPQQVSGYAYGLGLERLATIKLGLKSIQELWSPQYLDA